MSDCDRSITTSDILAQLLRLQFGQDIISCCTTLFFSTKMSASEEDCSTSTISWSRALSFSTGCDDLLVEHPVEGGNNDKAEQDHEQQQQQQEHEEKVTPHEEVEFHYYGPATTYTVHEYVHNNNNNVMTDVVSSTSSSNHPRENGLEDHHHAADDVKEVEDGGKSLSAYSLKRKRNNLAVRKSREKAKRRFEELRRAEARLEAQNEVLAKKIEEMEESLAKLRAYYGSLQIQPEERQQQQQPVNVMYAM